MPDGIRSVAARSARVREQDPKCTAYKPDGTVCGDPTGEAHHWYPKGNDRREKEEHMQGVCADCHGDAHRWIGRFPPDLAEDMPFRLDVPNWPRRP